MHVVAGYASSSVISLRTFLARLAGSRYAVDINQHLDYMPTFSKLFFEDYKNFFVEVFFGRCNYFFGRCFRGQSLRPLAINQGGPIDKAKPIGQGYRLVSANLLRRFFT